MNRANDNIDQEEEEEEVEEGGDSESLAYEPSQQPGRPNSQQNQVQSPQNEQNHESPRRPVLEDVENGGDVSLLVNIRRLKQENASKDAEIRKLNSHLVKMEMQPKVEELDMKLKRAKEMFAFLRMQVSTPIPTVPEMTAPHRYAQAQRSVSSEDDVELPPVIEGSASSEDQQEPTPPPTQMEPRVMKLSRQINNRNGAIDLDQNIEVAQGTLDGLKRHLEQTLAQIATPTRPGTSLPEADEMERLEQKLREATRAIRIIRKQLYLFLGFEDEDGETSRAPTASSPGQVEEQPSSFSSLLTKYRKAQGPQDTQEKLTAAARRGDLSAVRRFLNNGIVKVDRRDHEGCTALIGAAEKGREDVVRMLVYDFGADIEQTDSVYGWTPIMFAAFMGHLDVIDFLLLQGADVNARNKKGNTALALAFEAPVLLVPDKDRDKTVEFLMKKGANF